METPNNLWVIFEAIPRIYSNLTQASLTSHPVVEQDKLAAFWKGEEKWNGKD